MPEESLICAICDGRMDADGRPESVSCPWCGVRYLIRFAPDGQPAATLDWDALTVKGEQERLEMLRSREQLLMNKQAQCEQERARELGELAGERERIERQVDRRSYFPPWSRQAVWLSLLIILALTVAAILQGSCALWPVVLAAVLVFFAIGYAWNARSQQRRETRKANIRKWYQLRAQQTASRYDEQLTDLARRLGRLRRGMADATLNLEMILTEPSLLSRRNEPIFAVELDDAGPQPAQIGPWLRAHCAAEVAESVEVLPGRLLNGRNYEAAKRAVLELQALGATARVTIEEGEGASDGKVN